MYSSNELKSAIYHNYALNPSGGTIDADDLAHVARSSAAIVLTMQDNGSLFSMRKDFNYVHHLSDEK